MRARHESSPCLRGQFGLPRVVPPTKQKAAVLQEVPVGRINRKRMIADRVANAITVPYLFDERQQA